MLLFVWSGNVFMSNNELIVTGILLFSFGFPVIMLMITYKRYGTIEPPPYKRRRELAEGQLHKRIDKLEKQITHLNREIKRLKKDNGAQD